MNAKTKLLLCCLTPLMLSMLLLGACNKATKTSPTEVLNEIELPVLPEPPKLPNLPKVPTVEEETVAGCDVLQLTARRVLEVSPGQVTLRVLATYLGDGEPYVRIIDASTGQHLGDHPLGNITLQLTEGPYRLFIFVEVSDSAGFFQCDGSVSFDISGAPEVPKCTGPECNPPPECDEDCEPPPCEEDCRPDVCLSPLSGDAIRGPFPQQGPPRAECAFFGNYVPTEGNPAFYVCKAATSIYISNSPFLGETCRGDDRHEISHVTQCACPLD
jgi:hypothetical protein